MAHRVRSWHGRCGRLLPVLALAFATSAQAGGLSFVEYDPPSAPNQGLRAPEEMAVSPDGLNVYTASVVEDSIGVFTRNPGTGALTFLEVQEDGVGGVDGLRRASGVAVSPDGNCVYGTGEQDDAVAVFSRNVVTGALSYVEMENPDRPQAVVVSPDDSHVYVLGTQGPSNGPGAVHVFSRTPPACALTFVEEATGDVDGLGKQPEAMAISADGAHVYVGGSFFDGTTTQGAVITLSRNVVTGTLSFVEREYNGAGGVDRLAKVSGMAVSPDGGSVYAASGADDSIVVFSRNAGTGDLTFLEFQKDGGAVDGLKGASAVAVSPDSAYVYVAGRADEAVAVFRRTATSGALRFLEVQRDPNIDPPNAVLPPPIGIGLSPLGDSLYAGGKGVTVFAVDSCGNGNRGPDEQCDDDNVDPGDGCSATCRLELCGAAPSGGCRGTEPFGAQLQLKNISPDTKDQLQFKWNKGDATLLPEYGDPTTTATYVLCIYDGSGNPQPLLAAAAPAGGTCKKGKLCWKPASTSYKYNDGLYTPDGLQIVQLKEGPVNGKAKMQFKGRGVNLLPPGLPLTLPVTVQVKNTQTGVCWNAVFSAADSNGPEKFKAKGD